MPVNASLSTPSSVTGTTTTAASVAASTQAGAPVPQVTRMAVEGIRGADGDMTWAGEWSSATSYVINQVVQYNGSSYVCIQGNSNMAPSSNTSQWTLMASKGDAGATGATGATGSDGAKGAVGDKGATGPSGSQGATGPQGSTGATGPQGEDGNAATVTVGSVTKVSAASAAAVTNTGSNTAAVLNFSVPTGVDGAQGSAATIAVGTVTTGIAGSSVTITNSGNSGAATLNFAIPRGDTGPSGDITWKGGWNASITYGVNESVYYNGSTYVCIQANSNNVPTNTTYWNIMARAGAEGGSIGSMEDTTISSNITDGSVLAYDDSSNKWKDSEIFSGTYSAPIMSGGTF